MNGKKQILTNWPGVLSMEKNREHTKVNEKNNCKKRMHK